MFSRNVLAGETRSISLVRRFDKGNGLSTLILVVETAFDLTGSTKEPDYACGIKNYLLT